MVYEHWYAYPSVVDPSATAPRESCQCVISASLHPPVLNLSVSVVASLQTEVRLFYIKKSESANILVTSIRSILFELSLYSLRGPTYPVGTTLSTILRRKFLSPVMFLPIYSNLSCRDFTSHTISILSMFFPSGTRCLNHYGVSLSVEGFRVQVFVPPSRPVGKFVLVTML